MPRPLFQPLTAVRFRPLYRPLNYRTIVRHHIGQSKSPVFERLTQFDARISQLERDLSDLRKDFAVSKVQLMMNMERIRDEFSSKFKDLGGEINLIKWIMAATCSGIFTLLADAAKPHLIQFFQTAAIETNEDEK
ncbi:hypothetical protein HOY82DRAFT_618748 [Tuber indicum]|nr:hypothetical protein HOY82DRAFT_618748 [Tuber indicum]